MTAQEIDQQIYVIATAMGFNKQSAALIIAQARLESADYTSNVFKNNLNAFGMKFVGQTYATKGTPAPESERSAQCNNTGVCKNSDFYAKYQTPTDSVRDVITRLYSKNIKGVTPDQLKNANTPEKFAELLKQRGYFGVTAKQYATGLKSKLKKINLQNIETLPAVTVESKKKVI